MVAINDSSFPLANNFASHDITAIANINDPVDLTSATKQRAPLGVDVSTGETMIWR